MATVVICYLHSNQVLCHTFLLNHQKVFCRYKSLHCFPFKIIFTDRNLRICFFALPLLKSCSNKAPFHYLSILSSLKLLFPRLSGTKVSNQAWIVCVVCSIWWTFFFLTLNDLQHLALAPLWGRAYLNFFQNQGSSQDKYVLVWMYFCSPSGIFSLGGNSPLTTTITLLLS